MRSILLVPARTPFRDRVHLISGPPTTPGEKFGPNIRVGVWVGVGYLANITSFIFASSILASCSIETTGSALGRLWE